MSENSNATTFFEKVIPLSFRNLLNPGILWGVLGVLTFSLSLPATRLAVADMDGMVVGLLRAMIAGVLSLLYLRWARHPLPPRALWRSISIVAVTSVLVFPLLTSIAIKFVPSSHGAVIHGLLPIATTIMAVLRAAERPSAKFWAAAFCGLLAVLAFAVARGAGQLHAADWLILISVAFCGLGYAEGGVLARQLGGPQVICWALVFSLPLVIPATLFAVVNTGGIHASPLAWGGLLYLGAFSMFLGFFAWYRGLALGGVAKIGQIQLAQPILTLMWSALLLGEKVSFSMLLTALVVLASVVFTQTARVSAQNSIGLQATIANKN